MGRGDGWGGGGERGGVGGRGDGWGGSGEALHTWVTKEFAYLGDTVIADFGISSMVAGTLRSGGGPVGCAARRSGNMMGTPNYM